MRFKPKFLAAAFVLGAIGLSASDIASAGCGGYSPPASAPVSWSGALRPSMMPALYTPGSERFIQVGDDQFGNSPGLVGMWRVTFTSDGTGYPNPTPPMGAQIDFATIQFHPDGTEIMVSGARAPSTGDVCMGVWRQIGERTYKIKHLALGWVSPDSMPPAPAAAYLGPTLISEHVTLNRARNAFEGTFTIDVYAKDESTLLAHLSGTMSGARFSFD